MAAIKSAELERLAGAGRRMYEGGLVAGALGAIGLRLGTGAVVVSALGSRLGFLEQRDIVVLDGNGLPAGDSRRPPTKDFGLLYAVLSARLGAGAVLRIFSPYATALAHRGRKAIEKSQPMLEHLGGVVYVPHYKPGTAGLAGAVAEALRKNNVAIVGEQGPVVLGTDLDDAVDRAEALEAAAKVIFLLGNGKGA